MRKRVKIALALVFVAAVGFAAWEGMRTPDVAAPAGTASGCFLLAIDPARLHSAFGMSLW